MMLWDEVREGSKGGISIVRRCETPRSTRALCHGEGGREDENPTDRGATNGGLRSALVGYQEPRRPWTVVTLERSLSNL